MYKKTTEELLKVLNARIAESKAEIAALQAVTINTKHKTLTNRAIENGRIGDYIGINKALFVSYSIKYQDGHTRYESATINAYSYENEDGSTIGSEGGLRTSRTITPTELRELLDQIIGMRVHELEMVMLDRGAAETLVHEYNAICDTVNEFEDKLTWASRTFLKIG